MNYYRYAPHVIEGMVSLKVGNLTYRTTADDLREIFSKYGKVGDVYVPKNRYNGESRGFAFVRFYDRRDAEDALDAMDGRILDGRELRVQMARYGRPNSPHRYGGGRSSYRRRSYGRSRSYDRRRRSYSRSYSRSRSRSHRRKRTRSRSESRSSRSYSRDKSGSHASSPVNNRSRSKSGSY